MKADQGGKATTTHGSGTRCRGLARGILLAIVVVSSARRWPGVARVALALHAGLFVGNAAFLIDRAHLAEVIAWALPFTAAAIGLRVIKSRGALQESAAR